MTAPATAHREESIDLHVCGDCAFELFLDSCNNADDAQAAVRTADLCPSCAVSWAAHHFN